MFGKQNSIFLLLAVSCLITAVMASKVREFSTKKFNANLLNLMARSSNPFNYPKCFNYYADILNELLEKYKRDHETCCNNADNERNKVDEKTILSRQGLANETDYSCALLKGCALEKSIDDVYDCYVTGGNANLKNMRELSNGATTDWAAFKEQKRLVTYNEEKCINKTRTCFEEESDVVYRQLDSCLAGLTDVPTPASTTKSTPTGSTTTKPTPTESTTTRVTPTGSTTTKPTPTESTTTRVTPTGSTTTKPTPTESTTTRITPTGSTTTKSTTKSSNENTNEEDD